MGATQGESLAMPPNIAYVYLQAAKRCREEADSAGSHYSQRIGDAFQSAGESIADVGGQLRDWLDRQGGKGS
jgi:hypothetical protein